MNNSTYCTVKVQYCSCAWSTWTGESEGEELSPLTSSSPWKLPKVHTAIFGAGLGTSELSRHMSRERWGTVVPGTDSYISGRDKQPALLRHELAKCEITSVPHPQRHVFILTL